MNNSKAAAAMTMTPKRALEIQLGVVPAAARVPSDMAELNTLAVLGFCPAKHASEAARARHIRGLIVDAIAGR